MTGTPADIVLRDKVEPIYKGESAPLISTAPDKRDGTRSQGGGDVTPSPDPVPDADTIFYDTFDNHADWTSTANLASGGAQKASEGADLPDGYDAAYTGDFWNPESGYPTNHASGEILASNSDKARGNTGKSYVCWRESYSPDTGWKRWNSDSQLIRYLGQEYDEIFVEFWMAFSPTWWNRLQSSNFTSKIFRAAHYDGGGNPFSGFQGNLGPMAFWDYKQDSYGIRNLMLYRGGPPSSPTNWYYMGDTYARSNSHNFTSSAKGQALDGGDPQLVDKVNGGLVVDSTEIVRHDQVFGPGSFLDPYGVLFEDEYRTGCRRWEVLGFC